jgi:hypothetical protein
MKRGMTVAAMALLALAAQPVGIQNVRLKVEKSTARDLDTTSSSRYHRTKEGTESVVYNIEVMNMSPGPLSDLKVKWAVLIKSGYHTSGTFAPSTSQRPSRVVEGERSINLGLGQRFMIDTGPIQMSVSQYDSTYGYREKSGEELYGYCVQVFAGPKMIAQEVLPQDTKQKIDGLRPQDNPAPGKAKKPVEDGPRRTF